MEISFNAFDYTAEDRFVQSTYTFRGKPNEGWIITRNGEEYLRLSQGHRPLRTMLCGDIREAVSLLLADKGLQSRVSALITHVFPASRIGEAFVTAARPEAIKVLIDHGEGF